MTREELVEQLQKLAYEVKAIDSYEIDEITDLYIYTNKEYKEADVYIYVDLDEMDISFYNRDIFLDDKPIIDLIFKYFETEKGE